MLRNELHQSFEPGLESAYAVAVPSAKEAMAKRILKGLGEAPGAGRMPPNPRRRPRRAKKVRIDSNIQRGIRDIIEGLPGKGFGWEAVVAAANAKFKANWTRQSLFFHAKIKNAFRARKAEIKKKGRSSAARPSESTIEYLEHQVVRLKAENSDLRVQLILVTGRMARWRQNAFMHGMTLEQLDEDLQENDRR